MNIQYLYNTKGKPVGVFIPITDWKKMCKKYQLPEGKQKSEKEELRSKL